MHVVSSSFALQIARANGAQVIATTSSDEKGKILSKLGANLVINYKKNPKWEEEVLKFVRISFFVEAVIFDKHLAFNRQMGEASTMSSSLQGSRSCKLSPVRVLVAGSILLVSLEAKRAEVRRLYLLLSCRRTSTCVVCSSVRVSSAYFLILTS